jgi:hypothetical protein
MATGPPAKLTMAEKTHEKSRTGRPRKAVNTMLITALIDKQDAMSRRVATSIRKLLAEHLDAAAVARVIRQIHGAARARLLRIPAAYAAQISGLHDPAEVRRVLDEEIRLALEELSEGLESAPRGTDTPPTPAPQVRASTTLAEARGQHARLQAELLDLRAKITPIERTALADLLKSPRKVPA